jgi:FtsP/CotA-like multicopper oxidase with cupredoxin domain
LAGAGLLAACGADRSAPSVVLVAPNGPQVNTVAARRYRDGATRTFAHTATTGKVDLGGPTVSTWSYDGVVPGRELRVTAGDQVQVQVTNRLPQDTTVHWHRLFCPVWAMVAMAASVTTIFLNSLGTRPSLLFQAISSVGRHASNEQ